jgi:hypothetical protein
MSHTSAFHDFGLVNVSVRTNLFMLMITYFGITYLCSCLNLNFQESSMLVDSGISCVLSHFISKYLVS